jgi:hypothetical protein
MGRKGRRKGRRRPISDINHNHTNITVDYNAVLVATLAADPTAAGGYQSIPLNTFITQLSEDLAKVYKLYRFTKVKFTFQANRLANTAGALPNNYAINYIPAKESPVTVFPSSFEEFEGPAVGFFSDLRGTPYHWHIPMEVLNAMPYNWYETRNNTPQFSDFTQGQILIRSNVPDIQVVILAHFEIEYQTLEDPSMLTLKTPVELALEEREKRRHEKARSEASYVSIYRNSSALKSSAVEATSTGTPCAKPEGISTRFCAG